MVKSFKKVIACLVAVLMVVCSMPFTALASPGEDKADIQLLFNPVYTGGYFDYSEVLAADSLFDYTMLQEAPLTFVKTAEEKGVSITGNLMLEAAKTVPVCESIDVDPLEEDTKLGVGDYFAVTVAMKDCPSIYAAQVYLTYSENIEPAGTYSLTKSRKAYQGLAGISEGKTIVTGGEASAVGSYYEGLSDGLLGDLSKIDSENRIIQTITTVQNGENSIDTTIVDPGDNVYTNPETGAVGYTFDGTALMATYIFKIIDEGDITFAMYDTDNTKVAQYGAAFLLAADEGKGLKPDQYTTYADNGAAGAMRMTFYGNNVNAGVTAECTHANTTVVNAKDATCTEDGYTGDTKCTDCEEIIANGTTIEKLSHSYTSSVTTDPTCTAPGVTTYTCVRGDSTYTENLPKATGHTEVSANNAVTATCKADGKESDTICEVCRETLTTGKTISKETVEHTPGEAVEENRVEPTYTTKGSYDEVVYCTVCETELSRTSKEIAVKTCAHDGKTTTVGAKDATCTEAGYTGDVICDACGTTVTTGETIKALGHDMQVVPGTAVTATCKADGKEADMACSRGDKTETGKTISKSTVAHTGKTVNGKTPTCTEPGLTTGSICSVCDTVLVEQTEIKPLGHKEASANNAVAPTAAKDGKEADTICSVCLTKLADGKVIPALGVNVTINDDYSAYGDIAGCDYGTTNVAYGTKVTLVANPVEGATFVGYQVAGKLVSTSATYEFTAYKDVTVTPIFAEEENDTITVVFYDRYSNVVASYINVTVADFQAAMATVPTAPLYAGYEFKGWSYTDDQLKKLATSTTVWAQYEEVSTGYTVTAPAEVEMDLAGFENGSIPFDTRVTVSAPGATAWKVNNAIIGYGESYSFYVGADIAVEPVFEAVTAKPEVAIVDCYKISADSHKVMFLATMNIPDGFKAIDHGFLYGKALAENELVIENVGNKGAASNAGNVKNSSLATSVSEQFGISYGVTAMNALACARAYITYIDAEDNMVTTYSNAIAFDYASGVATVPGEDD